MGHSIRNQRNPQKPGFLVRVMGDRKRARIMRVVQSYGAIHKSELLRATGFGWGTIGHHLDVLRNRGLVELDQDGSKTWVQVPDLKEGDKALLRAASAPERQRILDDLSRGDRQTIAELSDSLQASRKVVGRHLTHLMGAGAVERTGVRPHRFRLTEQVKGRISKVLGRQRHGQH